MSQMIGEGGPGHCSVFLCLNRAVVKKTYRVAYHGGRDPYDIIYYFCTEHIDRGFENKPYDYPQHKLTKEKNYG